MKFSSLIILTLFVSFFSISSEWELEKNKDGIKVYTRDVAGSDIKEFKAVSNIKADRIKIARVLTRAGDFQNWMPHVEISRVLKKVSSTKLITYYTLDMPWPVDNRDVVLDLWIETNNEKKITWVKMKENLTAKKEDADYIRMTKASSYWKLTSKGNTTDVVYQAHAEPAGSVPDWVVNMFIVDGPYDTIIELKKKVE